MKLNRPVSYQALWSITICLVFGASASAYPQAGGGKVTSDSASPSTKPATKSTKTTTTTATTPKAKAKTSLPRSTGAPGNIEGKWWTTGNDFGAGEVVFTQNGANVSGVIRWSDGRTGSLTGKMIGKRLHHTFTTSNGDGGSGWLEQSWNLFLGGSWRNQQTKDGSWTLTRLEGNWCFGGSRSRIRRVTHDATGRVGMVTEDGTQEEGHLDGPWLYLHSDMGNIKGEMDYRGNRMQWSTGFQWTWCGR
jgi:hypothetical protein